MRIIAHRGASARAPENTLAALALARELGANAAEIDARTCGTGEVVVFHDEALERLAGVPGLVRETPLARLRELRVGGEPIPLLEEVLATADRPPGLVVELKSERWNDLAVAREAVRVILARRANGPITISSFNPLALRVARRLAPAIPRAMLAHAKLSRPLRDAWMRPLAAPRELHLESAMIDAARVAWARRRGLDVVAWTVNDPAEAVRLREVGAAGIITDAPDVIRGAIA